MYFAIVEISRSKNLFVYDNSNAVIMLIPKNHRILKITTVSFIEILAPKTVEVVGGLTGRDRTFCPFRRPLRPGNQGEGEM